MEDYKEDLVNHYVYEIDNDTKKLEERKEELKRHYSDEYLNDIIKGTINVIDKILEKDNDNFWEEELRCYGKHIFLNICGGFGSDRIVETVNNNLVSLWLMRKTFGEKFDVYIDRCYYN